MIELYCEYLSVRYIWLYVIIMSRTRFRVNLHSYICLNLNKLLAQNRRDILSLSDSNGIQTHNYLVPKRKQNHLVITGQMIELYCEWVLICPVRLAVCYYHVT